MTAKTTVSISLTKQLKAYIRQKVESGQYESPSEVVRQSLRAMQEREEQSQLFWSGVRKKVRQARDAIASGDVLDGPEFMKSRIDALKSQSSGTKLTRGREG